jgi:hypothetical protein
MPSIGRAISLPPVLWLNAKANNMLLDPVTNPL